MGCKIVMFLFQFFLLIVIIAKSNQLFSINRGCVKQGGEL